MPQFCKKCIVQGHSTAICPKGQRETHIPPPATRARPPRNRTQAARRNAEESPSTIQLQYIPPNATHTSSHKPPPPYNPPPHPPPPSQGTHLLHGAEPASAHPHQPTNAAPATSPDPTPPHIPPPYTYAMPSPAPQIPAEVEVAHHLQSATNPAPSPSPIPPPSSNATSSPPPAEAEVAHQLQSAPAAPPLDSLPQYAHPHTHHKSSTPPPPICKQDQHKRKSVSFDLSHHSSEPRMEANAALWDAVKHRMSIMEQTRPSTSGTSQPHTSVSKSSTEPKPSHINSSQADSDSGSSIAADSPPPSLHPAPKEAHNSFDNIQCSSYDSEGEEPQAEQSSMEGHTTDDFLSKASNNTKRNKRHPDKPLNVQLRVRKDPNPSPSC